MEVRLVVEQGKKRRAFTLSGPSARVGRAKGNAVRIPSAEVSREHCRVDLEEGLVKVEDLGSVNGTFVNGARVEGQQVLRPGDRLEVGPVTFVVEYELTPDALERLRRDEGEDYEVVEPDEEVVELEEVEEEVVELEVVEEAPAAAEEDPYLAAVAQEEIHLDLSFIDEDWHLPEGGELRDILAGMEDEEGTAHRKKKKE
jgi:pSer/pThr/pTyr-binding forkhead associated (FHA) protein